ncbi:MAG: acyl-CoA/acyl-ACP dehydrogenase [Proteobacteria bacterium]|nr:acyl-CoA/acyl-ACP dehydrogenase [Pseudomonadota bacterium]
MPYCELDLFTNKESKAMVREVKTFSARTVRPAGIQLDSLPLPSDVIREDSPLWEVFAGFRKLDLHLPGIPGDLGGMGDVDGLTLMAMAERLGHGDAGLAMGLMASQAPFQYAALLRTPELEKLVQDYCGDSGGLFIGCLVPDRGEGLLSGNGDGPPPLVTVTATGRGRYAVNGAMEKALNANIATHAVLEVAILENSRPDGRGILVLPLDLPGVTRKEPVPRPGQRSLNMGGLVFSDVKLPKGCLVPKEPRELSAIRKRFFVQQTQYLAAVWGGIAWAALDEALAYSKKRIQGGVPIFRHANIRAQLFNMFKMVEAVRANTRRLAQYHDHGPDEASLAHAVAAKCLATETAVQVSSEGIQIFGGYGLTKEFPMEKFFRDARLGTIEWGVNEDLALEAAATL